MSPSNELSAEFLRGAIMVCDDTGQRLAAAVYRKAFAAAEAREAAQPTAAEVIAACEKALGGIDRIARCVHLDMGGKHKYHIQHPGQHESIEEVKRALDVVRRWKEANGGMPIL